MNDAFVNKSLECPVNSNPVKPLTCFFFYISMCQCAGLFQEKLDDLFAAACHAEIVSSQELICLPVLFYGQLLLHPV
jgi:hypothetical protein